MVTKASPKIFKYFMTEFEHRNEFFTFQTLVNILKRDSNKLSIEDKVKYLEPQSLNEDVMEVANK